MRLNVELNNELYRDIAALAEKDGRSLSDVVRVLLLDWRERRWEQLRARACEVVPDEEVAG